MEKRQSNIYQHQVDGDTRDLFDKDFNEAVFFQLYKNKDRNSEMNEKMETYY